MGKQAAVAALVATVFTSATANADEIIQQQVSPTTMFYFSIPLGATTAKERAPTYGLALQGKRPYETVRVDNHTFNFAEGLIAGLEMKWVLAGAVVVGAGAYAVSKDKGRSSNYSGSQNQQQNSNPPAPPPADCTDPCKK